MLALALFVLPLLRRADAVPPEGADPARAEKDLPFAADVAEFEAEFSLPLAETIQSSSEEWFGRSSERLADSGAIELGRLDSGERAYRTHCIGCHGTTGDGAGFAARYLAPRPRNFRKGTFKFTSTAAGARPQRKDLFQTITRGLAGSSMPEFSLLSEPLRWNLVEYVRYLAVRGEFEQMMLDLAWEEEELPDAAEVAQIVLERWSPARLHSIHPGITESAADAASVERGRLLFNDAARASCASCHGPLGRGDGPTAGDYLDDWGYPIRPRDLASGVFRAGVEGADLYRTISAGIKGTPMGSFEGALAPADIWDLVHFVQSLSLPPSNE